MRKHNCTAAEIPGWVVLGSAGKSGDGWVWALLVRVGMHCGVIPWLKF
jgi:hypothetical protein